MLFGRSSSTAIPCICGISTGPMKQCTSLRHMGLTLVYVIAKPFVSENTFALAVMAGSIGRHDSLTSAVCLF